jgi:hypothetical protein
VGGVLLSLLGCMRCFYGRILGGIGGISLPILDLRWEMDPKIVSGMISWCWDMALKVAFPNLFGIACAKDASVVSPLELSGGTT